MRAEDLRRTPVPELARLFVDEERELPSGGLSALREDPRAGARAVAERIEKRNHKAQAEGRRLTRLCAYEQPLWDEGITLVGGVDEVGMAPLAGPVIAAAVILKPGARIKNVNDSKQLTPEEREALDPEIRAEAVAVGLGRAEVHEIDSLNIYNAGLLALRRAVLALDPQPQHLLVDARKLEGLKMPQQPIIKGDALSITIGAASIVAKVFRDRMMAEFDAQYPGYGFAGNKGYPTPDHLEALERLGACPLHRRSFAPVARKLGLIPVQQELFLSGLADLTGKQRRFLRALGHHLAPVLQVGHEGVSDAVVRQAGEQLEAHELIKVKVGDAVDRHEAGAELARRCEAHLAQVLGRTLLLYKRRKEKPAIVLPAAK